MFEVTAIMIHPTDEAARNEYLVTRTGTALKSGGTEPYRTLLDRYGGIGALADARPMRLLEKDWSKSRDGWFVTFLVFNALYRLDQTPQIVVNDQASLNKAVYLIEQGHENITNPDAKSAIPKNRNDIIKTWSKFKNVSHLCHSFINFSVQPGMTDELYRSLMLSGFDKILSAARFNQAWATTFVSPRSQSPLLAEPNAWLIPEYLNLPKAPQIGLWTLSDQEIKLLKAYQAPMPSV